MTGNAHSTNSGNGSKTYWGNVAKQSAGLFAAEGTSIAASLGVVAFADKIAGPPLHAVSKVLSNIVFEPYLDFIEGGLDKFCKLEECKWDTSKSRRERAEKLAHTTLVFGASFAAAMAAKLSTRKVCDSLSGVYHSTALTPNHGLLDRLKFWKHMTKGDWLIFAMDEGVHYGSLLMMNTAAATYTDDMIRATTSMLMKSGVPEAKAHELAAYTYIWEMPNALGFASGVGGIMLANKWGWNNGHAPATS